MFITSLEMIGFKSFASRVLIEFRPGIMAVVGPNGCGKTNIVDAVRWVLGEQRTSTLRAERMEAVIFNGTPHRRPLGMTDVTLTIENTKGILPSPYTEVAITRRLFRSGESEYLINRNPSRLRDISDMFADTGLGNTAYSIIELAMVEGIITGPSETRRVLLEEAAGVARYKSRRQAAIRRLLSTRENLSRIDDIYQEVERNYRSLKRQASRARRYQTLTRALQLRLLADLSDERLDILEKRKPLENRLTELQDEQHDAEIEGARATSDLLSLEGRELAIIDKYRRAQDSMKRIERSEAELDREKALTEQRIRFLETEISESEKRHAELTERIGQVEEQTESTHREAEELKERLDETKADLVELEKRTSRIADDLEIARKKAAEARRSEAEAEQKLSSYRDRTGKHESENRRLTERIEALTEQLGNLTKHISSMESNLAEAGKKHESALKARRDCLNRSEAAESDLETARTAHSKALTLQARRTAELEAAGTALKAHHAQSGSPSTRPESLRRIAEDEALRNIGDRIECLDEHRAAIAAALFNVLEALDRPTLQDAMEIARTVSKGEQADLRYPVAEKHNRGLDKLPPEAAGCLFGPDLVKNKGELGDFIRHRLSDVVLTPDLETLASLAQVAAKRGLRLVSPEGVLLEPDGVLHAGKVDPDGLQVGWLARLHELEEGLSSAEAALDEVTKTVKTTAGNLADAERKAAAAREALKNCEDGVAESMRQIAAFDAELSRGQERHRELGAEITRSQHELDQLHPADISKPYIDKLQADLEGCSRQHSTAVQELQSLEQAKVEITAERSTKAVESARLGERLASAEKNLERYAREARTATDNMAALNARLAENNSEQKRVRQAAENIAAQIGLQQREKAEIESTIENLRAQRAEIKEKRDATTSLLNDTQERQKDVLKEQNKVEAEVITFRERLREVDRRLSEEGGINPNTVTQSSQDEAVAELEEIGFADKPLEQLRTRLQSIGPVNMLALEEIKDVEERYRFLSDQKADLENGIEVLEETIDRINQEARRIFREAFNRINENFQEIFHSLFEGGEARLTLLDGDPLEAEIRILATPSGKKLQPLSMLSGGEKALTAIALLFGIYRVRPSPFCILDEVDAPLDDANVVRFNRLVRQYAVDTQFLIVTHNKRTMEAADCLYGVTLGEDGSSKMVSVRIKGGEDGEDEGRENDNESN